MARAIYEGDDPQNLPDVPASGPWGPPRDDEADRAAEEAGLDNTETLPQPGDGDYVPSSSGMPMPDGGINMGMGDGGYDPSNGSTLIPPDLVGDVPPPPVPAAPSVGVAGSRGAGGSTFARPGSAGMRGFRSMPSQAPRPRFGPGVPSAGGGVGGGASTLAGADGGTGLSPDEAAELLRRMAGGMR